MTMNETQLYVDSLACSADSNDRKQSALHPDAHPETLSRLIQDSSLHIVGYAAGHPNTSPEDLVSAVHRAHDGMVALESVRHPSRSLEEIMEVGVSNSAASVQHVIARNPNTPAEALVELCRRLNTSNWLLREVAAHPNCPESLLLELADGERRRGYRDFEAENVLYDILRREECPVEIAQANIDHPNVLIAAAARGQAISLPTG